MTKIRQDTKDVQQNNSKPRGKIHSFSRSLAREIRKKKGPKGKNAAHEALIHKYISHRVGISKKEVNGKKCFFITIEELAMRFPYIKPGTIWEIVTRLAELGFLEIEKRGRNIYRYDRTLWYHVTAEKRNASEQDVVYFDSELAAKTSVPAAVVYYNFNHWLSEAKKDGLEGVVEMSPTELSRILPFSISTIERALEELEKGYICKCSETKPIYKVCEKQITSFPETIPSNPETIPSFPEMITSNPDNDTFYKDISRTLEGSSKQNPADSRSELCSGVEKADDVTSSLEISGSFNTMIAPAIVSSDTIIAAPVFNTLDGSGAASAIGGVEITSLQQLHDLTRMQDAEIRSFPTGTRDQLISVVASVASKFMAGLGPSEIYELHELEDRDKLTITIAARFSSHVKAIPSLAEHTTTTLMVLHGALECIIGSLLYRKGTNQSAYFHGIDCLQSLTYRLSCAVYEVLKKHQEEINEEWMEERHGEFASPDKEKEDNASLSPAQKARIVRNGVTARNQAGWIFMGREHQQNLISLGKAGLRQLEKLFTLNEALTPADVLLIVDHAMKIFTSRPMPKEDAGPLFTHFHQYSNICHMVNALPQVVERLSLKSKLPEITYLKAA